MLYVQFNNNIRCIEIDIFESEFLNKCWFNNNIRCIEIGNSKDAFLNGTRLITT